MVDRGDRRVRGGIYVLRLDGVLNVKRLVPEGSRKVIVRSDNRTYPDLPPLDRARLDLVGRVVWSGRRFA